MHRHFLAALFAGIAFFAAASVASAHAHLKASDPAADATVAASPAAIRLTFDHALVAKFSGATITDTQGHAIALGEASTDQGGKELVVPVPAPLAAGDYTVDWHVVSVDTHRMKGSFKFRIKQ